MLASSTLAMCIGIAIVAIIVIIAVSLASASQNKRGFPPFSTPHIGPVISHGDLGEMVVAQILGETVPGCRYVINDLTVAFPDGYSFQIDHILIDARGVLVIETKNFVGHIYGREDQQEWVQIYGDHRKRFYNPVMQNNGHVIKLRRLLPPETSISSVVVFVRGELKGVIASNVYDINGFRRVLAMSCAETPLPPEKMEQLYQKLIKFKEERYIHETKHMQNIQQRKERIATGCCPKCGSSLRVVNGKGKPFLGCSAYPRCNYTQHLNS